MNIDIDSASELVRQAMMLTLLISAPILLVGLLVGVAVSLVQAVTQIQEQTLSFIPKIVAMIAVAAVTLPWIGEQLLDYTRELLTLGISP